MVLKGLGIGQALKLFASIASPDRIEVMNWDEARNIVWMRHFSIVENLGRLGLFNLSWKCLVFSPTLPPEGRIILDDQTDVLPLLRRHEKITRELGLIGFSGGTLEQNRAIIDEAKTGSLRTVHQILVTAFGYEEHFEIIKEMKILRVVEKPYPG